MPRLLRWNTPVTVAVGALFMTATALAGTGWTVASTPPTSTNAVIYAAFAHTDSDAWAVGTAFGTAGSASPPPISYHWNGATWTLTPTGSLRGVAGGLGGVRA